MPERSTALLTYGMTMISPRCWIGRRESRLRNPAPKMYEYSLQVAAYVAAANYVYKPQGLNISGNFIVVAIPDEAPQIKSSTTRAYSMCCTSRRVKRFTRARS